MPLINDSHFIDFVPVAGEKEVGMLGALLQDTSNRLWKRICTFESPIVDPLRSAMKKWIQDLPLPTTSANYIEVSVNESASCIKSGISFIFYILFV